MMIIFAFLIFWGISTFFPRFQNLKLVKKLIKKVSKTIEKLSILMMIGFGFLALISIFLFDGVEVLYSGVFTLAFIGSFYLRKLPYATEEDRHPVELKMIIGVVTFIIALLWLILFGADMLRL
mgnify:CR=1 FL=1